jgi:hypothetical protein
LIPPNDGGRPRGPDRPYCPDPEANFRRAQQLYRLADSIDAGSFGFDEAGGAQEITRGLAYVGIPYPVAWVIGEVAVIAPDLVSGYIRSLGDSFREACE